LSQANVRMTASARTRERSEDVGSIRGLAGSHRLGQSSGSCSLISRSGYL
jgi:hypothetical protein